MKIIDNIDLRYFEPWSSAEYWHTELFNLGLLDKFDDYLTDVWLEGMSREQLNDAFIEESESFIRRHGYTLCDCCDSWVKELDTEQVFTANGDYKSVCPECMEEQVLKCADCGYYFFPDYPGKEIDGEWLCEDCVIDRETDEEDEEEDDE